MQCERCGAPVQWDGSYGKPVVCAYCGVSFIPAATQLVDVWLMTDPVARARYVFENRLATLEHDIRYEVMRGGEWSKLDRAYLREIGRLEADGSVYRLASFWSVSPHPPVYRARRDGELHLGGQRFPFKAGQEILWACPMTRDRFDLRFPVLITDLKDTRVQQLCGEMTNAMQGRMRRAVK